MIWSLLSIIPNNKIIYCDIKGSVKNPGVYKVMEKSTIQNVIELAGGLTDDAYTENINLSKLVKDEMVIYINNKREITKINSLNNCVCKPIYKYIDCETNEDIDSSYEILTTQPIIDTTLLDNITTTKFKETTKPMETTKKTNETTTKIIEIPTTTKVETTNLIDTTTQVSLKININTCSIEDLININGLGEVKAQKIIDYRESNGLFSSVEELLNVDGIGNKTLEKIKEYIEI